MRNPDVSFAIACYNCRPFLAQTVASALAQHDVTVELLLVDDGSSDGTQALMETLAQGDERIRTFSTPSNGGPGAARNIAMAAMHGHWYAVLDSDDLIAPSRSRDLIAAADHHRADMIADDLLLFGEGLAEHRFLQNDWRMPGWIELDRYFEASALFGTAPNPGFLKPMIRRTLLDRTAIAYDERLRIAEDDDLVVRLLMTGARYWLEPRPLYQYRKHGLSISHRLSSDHIDRMALAGDELDARVHAAGRASTAYNRRRRALANAVAFTHAIDALKARQPLSAARAILRRPTSLPLFRMPLGAAMRRLTGRTMG